MLEDLALYGGLLTEIKLQIRQAQNRAASAVNTELLRLYWNIGRLIQARQLHEGWGARVIPRLSRDLRNELPELKGFSERNIWRMVQFAGEYPSLFPIGSTPLAKLGMGTEPIEITTLTEFELPSKTIVPTPLAQIPWAHNILLMEQVCDLPTRFWYAERVSLQGWSYSTLSAKIKQQAHLRQGTAVSNFSERLPMAQSELAEELLKDPYIFDFLTLEEPFRERELETSLVQHLKKFLLELGRGFAFVGRQYRLEVSDKEFYLDLLFYHIHLRSFIVIELKKGEFKPEYAGKMNFYCSLVDEKLKHPTDQPTIGLILCQTKDRILAEYALRDIHKPIGVADYELTRALPDNLLSSLPTIEQIETELQENFNAS